MKSAVFGLTAAALLISAAASVHDHRLAHEKFHNRRQESSSDVSTSTSEDGCVVVWTTWYGKASCE